MIHYNDINLTALQDNLASGQRDTAANVISLSDNPAHTALALLRRIALDGELSRDEILHELRRLMDLVEYRCITDTEDVIAELRAGDVDHALKILTRTS